MPETVPVKPLLITGLELLAGALAVYGVWSWSHGAAWVLAGVFLLAEAYALERRLK